MDVESVFENLPNFRQAGGRSLCNQEGRRIKDGLIFRSSRTDFLTQEEKLKFLRLGIRSIIDLRRKSEYERAEGSKVLDDLYPPHLLERGEAKEMKPSLRWGGGLRKRKKEKKGGSHPPPQEQQQGKGDTTEATDDGSGPCIKGKRYLVNLMTMDLIWYVFGQINFFVRYLSLLLVLVDWIFGCHLFVKFFSWALVNKQTLAMQYFDMLEYTKPAVADILRLIIDKSNVPVLIHCAHGKDRTGLIVAVVLGCLEVDDETIVEDYSQSEVTSFLVVGRVGIVMIIEPEKCVQ